MEAAVPPLPDDLDALKALLAATLRRADEAEARLASAQARESATKAMIAHLKLQIAKLRREQYGSSGERSRRLLDQMGLQFKELEAAAAKTTNVTAFERKRRPEKSFPEHLPRERVVIPAPCACPACGGMRLSKVGEDVTETLEAIPLVEGDPDRAREGLLPDCETITQPPAPLGASSSSWPTSLSRPARRPVASAPA